jgi:hypothetical protein
MSARGPGILDYFFRASRCFRKELSRVALAFPTLTASVFVGFCFGCGALFTFPTDKIIGITAGRIGCVLIGPIIGLVLGMIYNARLLSLFKLAVDWPCPR